MAALDILYEDDALLFVNKPAGIVVQRGYDADEPVLLEIAMQHTQPLFLMQRLDRGTSGVMFFSKLASINANLTRQFEQKRIRKRYVAFAKASSASGRPSMRRSSASDRFRSASATAASAPSPSSRRCARRRAAR